MKISLLFISKRNASRTTPRHSATKVVGPVRSSSGTKVDYHGAHRFTEIADARRRPAALALFNKSENCHSVQWNRLRRSEPFFHID